MAENLLGEISAISRSSVRERVVAWVDPEAVFLALARHSAHGAWLDAGADAHDGWSHLCVLGPDGYVVGTLGERTRVRHVASGRSLAVAGDVLEVVERTLPPPTPGEDAFSVGWVGWIGYETGARSVGAPAAHRDDSESVLLFADRVISFDHARRRILLRALDGSGDGAAWLDDTATLLGTIAGDPPVPPSVPRPGAVRLRHSLEHYRSLVVACQRHIVDGDAYQICLTNQMTVATGAEASALFRRLRRLNPTPRGGLVWTDRVALVSSSPESFLEVDADGRIETRPIKGTRPRGADPDEDEALRAELVASEKERAENLMIVDLMRNDFSRVARLGTVEVARLFALEAYANVLQLVSTVVARLAPGESAVSAIRATFPAGSMTGAPKLSAMTILERLEGGPRGAYAGAYGWIGVNGAVRLSMTIRSIVLDERRGRATIGTGGGITALSDPDEEVAEMLLKAQPLLSALAVPESSTLAPGDARADGRAARLLRDPTIPPAAPPRSARWSHGEQRER